MSVCVCVGCVVTGVRVVCDGAAFPQGGEVCLARVPTLPSMAWVRVWVSMGEAYTRYECVCVCGLCGYGSESGV